MAASAQCLHAVGPARIRVRALHSRAPHGRCGCTQQLRAPAAARASEHAPGLRAARPRPGRSGGSAAVGRAAWQGSYSRLWRGARALRARPPGEGASHKEGLCRRPARRRRQGPRRETPPGPPWARNPPAARAADTAPGGHQSGPGTARPGGGWRPAAGAGGSEDSGCAPRAHWRGALERCTGPTNGDLRGTEPCVGRAWRCLSLAPRPCLQLSNLGSWEAGRGVWGSGQRPSPPRKVCGERAGWREA